MEKLENVLTPEQVAIILMSLKTTYESLDDSLRDHTCREDARKHLWDMRRHAKFAFNKMRVFSGGFVSIEPHKLNAATEFIPNQKNSNNEE